MSENDDPLLDAGQAASRVGIARASWRSGVTRGYLPPPDDPGDQDVPVQRRRPRWRRSTIDTFVRVGQGYRSDLVPERERRRAQQARDLARPAPPTSAGLDAWLRDNHRALLDVADTLTDHRDDLLDAAGPGTVRDEVRAAIDLAAERVRAQPSLLLATAVSYAMFLLGHHPRVAAAAPEQVREVLQRHAHLCDGFNLVRPGRTEGEEI